MEYTFSSVFSSATFPEYTYVNRKSSGDFTYEERLRMALEQRGHLIVIDGPSKIGKTVLCEAVIGRNLIAMTGRKRFLDGGREEGGYSADGRSTE